MRSVRHHLFLLALISLVISNLSAQVSGTITSDTTWTAASSPVSVTGSVLVPLGKTLTIEAGTEVRFSIGTGLVVEGKLVAQGTAADTIRLTSSAGSPARGDWNGVEFANTSNVGSVFTYVKVGYVGNGANQSGIFYRTGAFGIALSHIVVRESSHEGVNFRASSPQITDSRFEDMDGFGVFSDLFSNFSLRRSYIARCTEGGVRIPLNAAPVVDSCTIEDNGDGIYVDIGAAPTITGNQILSNVRGIYYRSVGVTQPTLRDNTIQGNTQFGIQHEGSSNLNARYNYWGSEYGPFHEAINPTGRGDTISNKILISPWKPSGTLSVTNITTNISTNTIWTPGVYWVKNTITVNNAVTLTLRPGVIVKFSPAVYVSVQGAIQIQGTTDSLVVFTSIKDDSYGGDTNGDGETSQPASADWGYIRVDGAIGVSNLILKYSNLGLYLFTSASMDSLFASSNEYGIYSNSGSSLTLTNSVFGSNNITGVNVGGASGFVVSVANSKFLGNGNYGLYLGDGTITTFTGSKATNNGTYGVRGYQTNAATSSSFTTNEFSGNGQYGLWYGSAKGSLITVSNNIFKGNGLDALVATKATISNNVFEGNRFGIILMGDLGSTYSGNTFTANTYNNVVGIRSDDGHLRGALTTTTPAGFASGVYLSFNSDMSGGDTLIISPGVIVKFLAGTRWNISGLLNAQGTSGNSIIFTSHRDHTAGGKVNPLSDTVSAAPGDWSYLRFLGAQQSVVDYFEIRYSGTGFWVNASSWPNTINHFTALRASSYGSYCDNATSITFENSLFRYNAYGLYISSMELILRNSQLSDNTQYGLYVSSGLGPKEISNCSFERNGNRGVLADNVTGPLTMVGNIINANAGSGVYYRNTTSPRTDVQYIGNTVTNNGAEGIISSRSRFVDNTITGNLYPLGAAGLLGYIYTDNTDVDGNVISGNTHSAIALREAVGDTLQYGFPAALPTHTYVVYGGGFGDYGSQPLVIEPGVIVKFYQNVSNTRSNRIEAVGTAAMPVIWTSWRDASYGGKTNAAADTVGPNLGDWNYLRVIGTGVSHQSRFEHIVAKYGNIPFYLNNMVLTNPMKHVRSTHASSYGIYLDGVNAVLDSVTVDSCTNTGIYATANSSIAISNSLVRKNGIYGLYAGSTSEYSQVTNSSITGNQYGIYISMANGPEVFQGNTLANNTVRGVFATAANASVDTLFMFSGNSFNNNNVGLMTSRAYVVDNVFTGNTFPMGLTGELSLAATGNANGNYYSGNIFQNNTYGAFLLFDEIYGLLGGTHPDSIANKTFYYSAILQVPASKELHIRPGTIVKGSGGPGLYVYGTIFVEGTSAQRVVFTSWKDDTYGGDTNKDTSATLPVVGDINFIRLLNNTGSVTHSIKSLNFRYGSNGLYVENLSNVTVDSSLFANNGYSIYRNGGGSVSVTASEFRDNNYGLLNYSAGSVTISGTNFSNHVQSAIYQSFNSTITATNNYWGAASGPKVTNGPDLNPAGTGDKIDVPSGVVNYRPYYTGRSGVLAGDVSQNGQISSFDASLVLQHVVASITLSGLQQAAADVTLDGSVSAMDASLILRYVVGYISGFRTIDMPAMKSKVVSSYVASVKATSTPDEYELVVRVQGDGIYATEMTVTFDNNAWSVASVAKTAMSDGFLLAEGRSDGRLKVAMAGALAAAGEGDWVVVRFKASGPASTPENIVVEQFIFNEPVRTTAVGYELTGIPTAYALGQNYPNPFNPSTTISYDVPEASFVTLRIYDMLGRQVATLIDGEKGAGAFRIQWNGIDESGSKVTSGIYFVAMTAQMQDAHVFRSVRKMVLTK